MAKTQKLSPIKQIIVNTKRLFSLAWKMDKKITFFYYFTTVIESLVPFLLAFSLKILIDQLQINQKSFSSTIPTILVIILASRYLVSLFDNVIFWAFNQNYLDYLFRYKLQNEIAWRFHQKIAKLDIAHFEDPKVQDLIAKTRDTMQWYLPDFLRGFSYLLSSTVAFIVTFIGLLPYGWWIPLVITITTIPRLYLQSKYGGIKWSIWGSGAPNVKKLWYLNYLLQDPITVKETRISQTSQQLLNKFKNIQTDLFNLNKTALDKYLRVITIPPLIEVIVVFIVTYQFLFPVLNGTITIGTLTLLITLIGQLSSRSSYASAEIAQIYESNFYVSQYFEFLNLPQILPIASNPVVIKDVKPPKIEFKNVSFSYTNDGRKILDNISFTIEPGESVALVGHNGAGKTTIIKLLCRFYDVTQGEILINGINIKDLDLTNWYKFLGTLFQEFVRYHFTVRENIYLSAPDKKDETAMLQALKKSGADEFVEKLPNKYDQILGKEFEDGEEISGGQWQKLAIARAFYEEPPVLILDEPTSAIDAEAEYQIFTNLEKQYLHKTLILVSHRFSTVRNANKIIVIDEGKIIETGSHQSLMKLNGEYAKLFSLQAKGYK